MAMSSGSKSPGRTPPFVLVALVLIVVILGYNYWRMSSSNRLLQDMNDKLSVESRDASEKRVTVEKSLETAREELQVLQGNLDQVKKSLQDKETELNNLRAEHSKITDENKKCKDSVAKCDADLQTQKTNNENLSAEKSKLEAALKTAQEAKKECSEEECLVPMKNIATLVSKMVGTERLTEALKSANFNAKIMEGVEKVDDPTKKEAKPEQVKTLNADIPVNATKNSSTLLTAPENLVFMSDKMAMAKKNDLVSDNEIVENSFDKEEPISHSRIADEKHESVSENVDKIIIKPTSHAEISSKAILSTETMKSSSQP